MAARGRRAKNLAVIAVSGFVLLACGGDDGDSESTAAAEEGATTLTEQGLDLDPLLEDDLAENRNGWGEGEGEVYGAEFTDRGFEATYRDSAGNAWTYADAGPLVIGDSSTTVEAQEPDGVADRDYGVVCRLSRSGPLMHYSLTVNAATGSYAIIRWSPDVDDPEILTEGEDDALAGIGEDGPVELTGTCLGAGDGEPVDLALAVDGDEVATVTDDDGLAPGISGLVLAPLGAEGGDEPVVFTDFEIRGEGGDDRLDLVDDFTDPDSGFAPLRDETNSIAYGDGGLVFDLRGNASATLPIRAPLPASGSVTVSVDGDLTEGYAGICLGGEGGQYEFAISADGYGSLGHYTEDMGDGREFTLIDEATGAYPSGGVHEVRARWRTSGDSTDLAVDVDGESIVATTGEDRVTRFAFATLCATVTQAAGDGAEVAVVYRDLEASDEG